MRTERRGYRFGPLERRGLLGPLRAGQALLISGGLAGAVEVLGRISGGGGVVGSLVLLIGTVMLATFPVGGRTLEQWAPISLAFGRRSLGRGGRRFSSRLPTAGTLAADQHPRELPRELKGVELVQIEANGRSVGALSERHGRLLTAVIACQALSFALLDPEVQERRLAQWGMVLTAAANGPIRRLQWVERTAPAQGDELARWLHSARDPSLPARGVPVVESYLELIGQSTQVTRDHEILLAIQLDTARLTAPAQHTYELVMEQIARIARGLETAEIRVLGALGSAQLARVLRTAYDPFARTDMTALELGGGGETSGGASAGPLGAHEHWDYYRCDGALHATFWISNWPRIDVSPMFMDALLADSGTVRTVAVTFEPIAPERSAREVEAAITRDRADSELRRRFGQSETARHRQAQEAAARREAELAAGHGEVRFSGFVTVSGRDESELRRACAEIHLHAARGRLELRRLYGQQAESFSFTLPLARGLR